MLFLTTIIILVCTGCDNVGFNYREGNNIAIAKAEAKHGERFEYYATYGDVFSTDLQFLVTCETYPDQLILLKINNFRTDSKEFLDNYIAVKYRDKTISFIQKHINKVFCEGVVFYKAAYHALPDYLSKYTTFNKFLECRVVPLYIRIEIKKSNYLSEEQVTELVGLLSSHGSDISLFVTIIDDSAEYSENIDENSNRIEKDDYISYINASAKNGEIKISNSNFKLDL